MTFTYTITPAMFAAYVLFMTIVAVLAVVGVNYLKREWNKVVNGVIIQIIDNPYK